MSNPLDAKPTPTNETDRLEALRAQLSLVQAERAMLHGTTTLSTPAPSKGYGAGGWVFAAFSALIFIAVMALGLTRSPRVIERVVHIEVPAAIEQPVVAAADPAPGADADTPKAAAADETADETPVRRPRRPRRPRADNDVQPTRPATMLNIDRCGGDPLCGVH